MSEKLNSSNNVSTVRKMYKKDGWDLLVDTNDANRVIENKKNLWQGITFGGKILNKIYNPFLEQAEAVMRYQKFKEWEMPEIILENQIRLAEQDRQVVKLTDEMVDDDFRKPLSELSFSSDSYVKQNLIFEKIFKYSGNWAQVESILHPRQKSKRASSEERLIAEIMGDISYRPFYDYIEAINKKNRDGNYEINSKDIFKIIKCYNSTFTKITANYKEDMEWIRKDFEEQLKACVDKSQLPPKFAENFEEFKEENAGKIKYEFIDESVSQEILGCTTTSLTSPINIRFAQCLHNRNIDEVINVPVVFHELMHKVGDIKRLFEDAWNPDDELQIKAKVFKAGRIINEGLTEYLGSFIMDPDGGFGVNKDPQKCTETGTTYRAERATIDFLRIGGKTEIPLNDFLEVYAEGWDNNYSSSREALLEKMFDAFPECNRNRLDLVDMILERFDAISN